MTVSSNSRPSFLYTSHLRTIAKLFLQRIFRYKLSFFNRYDNDAITVSYNDIALDERFGLRCSRPYLCRHTALFQLASIVKYETKQELLVG